MQLFVCNRCGCVDHVDFVGGVLSRDSEQHLCTECRTGFWHGQFPKLPYDPETDLAINRPNHFGIENST